jgi:hypothetical protein
MFLLVLYLSFCESNYFSAKLGRYNRGLIYCSIFTIVDPVVFRDPEACIALLGYVRPLYSLIKIMIKFALHAVSNNPLT